MTDKNRPLRKFLGVIGIGLGWGAMWAALFCTIGLVIEIVHPEDIDPGESPVRISGIGLAVGFVSGAIFGTILSVAEHRKSISDLALGRVALWGILGAAVWPLLTPLPDSMVFFLCPIGALCASVSVAIARRAGLIGRLLAGPLKAVCE